MNVKTFGARYAAGVTDFRVWAPNAKKLEVCKDDGSGIVDCLNPMEDGFFEASLSGYGPGTLYKFLVDGEGPWPDPASDFQPRGVHGPAEIIDHSGFNWTDDEWKGIHSSGLIVYELHVGTFSPEGTFRGVEEKLGYLKDLGVTAIELMPVADFPGERNWGYDGVSLFAPARCYGRPEDLKRLVDAAHRHNIAVFLDVVYNHFGPDGNYTGIYSSDFYTDRHKTPWGDAINFDGPGSEHVREFFFQNALFWLREYHIDGLRIDATHAIIDDSEKHFLAELVERVREEFPERPLPLIAEDHRNLAMMIEPSEKNGWGLDAVWSDDFHHISRVMLHGDNDGYYRDYEGTISELFTAIDKGWLYCGEYSKHLKHNRGTEPGDLPYDRFVNFIQNHDQTGNRAFGERLNHQISPAEWRALSTLFLLIPETPMLFMGQEFSSSSPFQYFTDHNEELGRLVTKGRREEFGSFSVFSNEEARKKIPDPQESSTFERSRLDWHDLERPEHSRILALYRDLISLRKEKIGSQVVPREDVKVGARRAVPERHRPSAPDLPVGARRAVPLRLELRGRFTCIVGFSKETVTANVSGGKVLLVSESDRYAVDPCSPIIQGQDQDGKVTIEFRSPAAVVFGM